MSVTVRRTCAKPELLMSAIPAPYPGPACTHLPGTARAAGQLSRLIQLSAAGDRGHDGAPGGTGGRRTMNT
jgi:hypothetical protein